MAGPQAVSPHPPLQSLSQWGGEPPPVFLRFLSRDKEPSDPALSACLPLFLSSSYLTTMLGQNHTSEAGRQGTRRKGKGRHPFLPTLPTHTPCSGWAQRVRQEHRQVGTSPTQTPREAPCRPGLPLPAHGHAKAAEGPSPTLVTTPCPGTAARL